MRVRTLFEVVLEALGFVPEGALVGQTGWAPLAWGRVLAPGLLGEVRLELEVDGELATYRARHVRRDRRGAVIVADLGSARSLLAAQALCMKGGGRGHLGRVRDPLAEAGEGLRQHFPEGDR
ncbi:MAG: hypothetical protein H6736_17145 [Alphaproteobacteria bacterium]|nr:hypothetical protein [Alphaproteobacteria bacterium]